MNSVVKQQISDGYKQTEVGVIPEDWEVVKIGSICDISVGKDVDPSYSSESDSKYCYPVFSNTVDVPGIYGYYSYPEYSGDVVTVVGRGVGLGTAICRSGGFGAIGRLLVLFPKEEISNLFLANYINNRIDVFSESSGVPQLTGIALGNYNVAYPPAEEQTAIANALSDVDALITSLEKLIAKKRAIKTAAMQQLLTGKKRLPPFDKTHSGYKQTELGEIPEDWEVKSYGQAFNFLTTASNSRSDLHDNGDYQYTHYGDIHVKWDSKVNFLNNEIPKIDSFKVKNASLLKDGDLIMADASEDYDGIGKSIEVTGLSNLNAVSGLHTFLLRDVGIFVDGYRGYLHQIKSTKQSFDRLATGLKVYGLTKGNLKEVLLPVPQKEEQMIIAKVLSDMANDIDILKKRLNKTQQLKQGMMQELLTGRTRLV